MLFSICVQWLQSGREWCVCAFAHWDWRRCQSARLDHSQGTRVRRTDISDTMMVCVCCECRKTPILAAIKRSISIVLKLAFSLRFSFETPLLRLWTISIAMLRCCHTIAIKSSLHFGFALLSFRFVTAYFLCVCVCFFSLPLGGACVLFAAREWQFGFSYFISSKEHWH